MTKKLIIVFIMFSTWIQADEIVINKADNPQNILVIELLKLALSKNSPNTVVIEKDNNNSRPRNIEEVKKGNLAVMWAGAKNSLQEELLAIKIPLFKGLLGYRVFIIRNGDQHRFDKINTLADLKEMTAGQGTYWGNNAVMEESELPLVTTNRHDSLFSMLKYKRYDYLTRAMYEPWLEIDSYADYDLAVEEKLLLVYPYAMYFFVAPNNITLAQKIRDGLNIAIDDGSYDQLFFNNFMINNMLEKINYNKRIKFQLPNSALPKDAPTEISKYWYDHKTMNSAE